MVYVININNTPLMPCSNVVARLLLKQGKAKVKSKVPFTIKLTYETTNFTQDMTCGIDTGSCHIGSSVVDANNNVIYLSQVEIRNDISDKMTQRAKYRRNRRNRKTRYRKARWLNRKNSIKNDRFSPTMISKFNSHFKEINFIKSILPITKLVLETATFDPHLLKNPTLKYNKWGGIKKAIYLVLQIQKLSFLQEIIILVNIVRIKRKIANLKFIILFSEVMVGAMIRIT